MLLNAYAQHLAAEAGCRTADPALLRMYEAIWRSGVDEARKAHYERLKLVRRYSETPGLFFSRIWPSLSTEECIQDAIRYRATFRNLPTWKQQNRLKDLAKHNENRVLARFFRRFGKRLWINKELAA